MERNQLKQQADQHRSECTFQVGDMVFLCLQPYNISSLKLKGNHKLAPMLYGPYKALHKIGSVAYKLELPPSSCIHLVFHVSCLKKVIGTNIRAQIVLLKLDNVSRPLPSTCQERGHDYYYSAYQTGDLAP